MATIRKQSLVDWFVEDEAGHRMARIEKVKFGYNVYVCLFDFQGPWFYPRFVDARRSALDPENHTK